MIKEKREKKREEEKQEGRCERKKEIESFRRRE